MLFSRCQNEDGIFRRLLQRLQESIEGRGREHVHLIYDIDLVLAALRWIAHLLHQISDVVYGVI